MSKVESTLNGSKQPPSEPRVKATPSNDVPDVEKRNAYDYAVYITGIPNGSAGVNGTSHPASILATTLSTNDELDIIEGLINSIRLGLVLLDQAVQCQGATMLQDDMVQHIINLENQAIAAREFYSRLVGALSKLQVVVS